MQTQTEGKESLGWRGFTEQHVCVHTHRATEREKTDGESQRDLSHKVRHSCFFVAVSSFHKKGSKVTGIL